MPVWIEPPTFVDGQLLSASALNACIHDIEFLKGRISGPQALFCGHLFESDHAYYWTFYKAAQLDYLYYWYYVRTGTAAVSMYISQDPTSWGSDYWAHTSITSASGNRTGHTNISALTDNQWYMMSIDVDFSTTGRLEMYRLELKSTNT